jgi:hypothetical protein
MLDRPTVFVLGAGAGAGLNMPLGDTLSDSIANDVKFYIDGSDLTKGQPRIYHVLRRLAQRENIEMSELVMAGRSIASGIRYTRSIDNYIYAHSGDERIKQVAKIAIVFEILHAERGSAVWVDDTTRVNRSQADVQNIARQIVAILNERQILQSSAYTAELNCKEFFRDFGTTLAG